MSKHRTPARLWQIANGRFDAWHSTLCAKGLAGWLGLILIGMLVISFAIWGIADISTGYGKQTLIRVGDTEITPQEYMRAQQDVLRAMSAQAGRSLSLQEARALGLDSRVLERLIGGAAVDNHARALHLGISDAALLEDDHEGSRLQGRDRQFQSPRLPAGAALDRHDRAGLFDLAARAEFAPADSQPPSAKW